MRLDDVLDVAALQGVPGLIGSLLTGIFASSDVQVKETKLGCAVIHQSKSLSGASIGFEIPRRGFNRERLLSTAGVPSRGCCRHTDVGSGGHLRPTLFH